MLVSGSVETKSHDISTSLKQGDCIEELMTRKSVARWAVEVERFDQCRHFASLWCLDVLS